MAKRIWDDYITDQDRAVYGSGVFGGEVGIGEKPAVLCIDVTNKNIGDESMPILEAIKVFGPGCCGEYGWNAVAKIRELMDFAHQHGIPVYYTVPKGGDRSRFDEKMPGWRNYGGLQREPGAIANEIAPQSEKGDVVVVKPTSGAFYNTDLEERLHREGIDTLLITGVSASGCVRSTVIDAFARGFKLNVVEDGVFDRGQASYAINLFDFQSKYADVLPLAAIKQRLEEHLKVRARR